MDFQDILYEKADGRATITINRPKVLNAFRQRTLDELIEAFDDADADRTIGVVVLTGAGDRAFCVGGDVSTMSDLSGEKKAAWLRSLLRLAAAIRNCSKPVIAAINGHCIGGGNELQLFCDLTIASDKATFAQVGPRVGACPVWGGTQLLPRLIGDKKAKEMIFLCDSYSAQEAERMGLVNKVVPHDKLSEAVDAWCHRILSHSPQSLRVAKTSLNFGSDLLYASLVHGAEMLRTIFGSEESLEGMRAFLEKRPADYQRFRR
ncbi:MAG: enoyl-CoA hydratase-related protein [Chloroflexota bacterium]